MTKWWHRNLCRIFKERFTVLFSGFVAAWKKKKSWHHFCASRLPHYRQSETEHAGGSGGESSRVNFLASLIGSSVLH